MPNQPIKSVHITNYYHKHSGGISTSYNNLLNAAARHQRHIRLIVPGENEVVEDVNDFAKIYYVPARYSPVFDKRYRVIMPWQYMPGGSIIRRILLDEMPDMIEVTDKYTLSMIGAMIRINKFKQIGRPMLVHFSCERMDDNIGAFLAGGKFGKWFARTLMANYLLPSFDYHIANSEYTAAEFYDVSGGTENSVRPGRFFNKCSRFFRAPRVPLSERVFVCPRGVDAVQFSPEKRNKDIRREMTETTRIPGDAVQLLYAGRISPEKNIGLLVDMMKLLCADSDREYRLLVAGAGPLADWLQNQSDRYLLGKIKQLGHVEKETLAGFYANADVFVHPNPREPFGIAPLEAMASGVPLVAPNAGGILSYATNENAWLVEPTAEKFADAVRKILADETIRTIKTAKAVETARANTREASADRLVETYDKMYADFMARNELYTDIAAARSFNYTELIDA